MLFPWGSGTRTHRGLSARARDRRFLLYYFTSYRLTCSAMILPMNYLGDRRISPIFEMATPRRRIPCLFGSPSGIKLSQQATELHTYVMHAPQLRVISNAAVQCRGLPPRGSATSGIRLDRAPTSIRVLLESMRWNSLSNTHSTLDITGC